MAWSSWRLLIAFRCGQMWSKHLRNGYNPSWQKWAESSHQSGTRTVHEKLGALSLDGCIQYMDVMSRRSITDFIKPEDMEKKIGDNNQTHIFQTPEAEQQATSDWQTWTHQTIIHVGGANYRGTQELTISFQGISPQKILFSQHKQKSRRWRRRWSS